jgi:hypothetical protein
MSQSKKRRRWSAAEKMRIVLAVMEAGTEISELCRVEGSSPTQYYSWKKQLVVSARWSTGWIFADVPFSFGWRWSSGAWDFPAASGLVGDLLDPPLMADV